jgi:hypothetical protein
VYVIYEHCGIDIGSSAVQTERVKYQKNLAALTAWQILLLNPLPLNALFDLSIFFWTAPVAACQNQEQCYHRGCGFPFLISILGAVYLCFSFVVNVQSKPTVIKATITHWMARRCKST